MDRSRNNTVWTTQRGSFIRELRQWQTFVLTNGYAAYSVAALLSRITIAKVHVNHSIRVRMQPIRYVKILSLTQLSCERALTYTPTNE